QAVADVVPELADRVDALQDWKQLALLSVESSRVPRWYRPGLLVIGDAAHVMSPVGGVGINYAIMDAVEAYNVLKGPLASGTVTEADLARVQKKREWPTRVIQTFQSFAQKRVFAQGLTPGQTFRPPFFMRIGPLRKMVARFIAFGISPARVEE
ncbi:MAG TPA: FAD-dependent monooxygenase, partial [Myxococcaceae bacterium]|nr:FAD-dependent monooxygenase [Myxococcaceae bacterium]